MNGPWGGFGPNSAATAAPAAAAAATDAIVAMSD